MKKAFLYTLLLIAATTAAAASGRGTYVKDEVLIRFSGGTDQTLAATALSAAGANVVERLGDIGWQRIRLPSGMSVDEALRKFKGLRGVDAVQPNFYYDLTATPNDPQYPNSSMYGLTKISAPAAWDLSTGSTSVVVANIDTGIKYTHEDLAANMWTNPGEVNGNGIDDDGNGFIDDYYGYDFYFNDGDPLDEHGHGTHTSGTIGAVGNNGVGVVGVNWNVRIMAIKIYDAAGISSTSAMLINAYNYVRMMKGRGVNIRVTNNSYGGCPEACGYDQATKDALDAMGDAGILNVFAAGNDARNSDVNPAYPASYTSPSIISVANSTSADEKNAGSNFGIVTVDLAAPGTGILSTIRTAANYGTSS
ncbi:MAG: S8 family serine peptidase, partial [Acidobacteriota bacterium]